MSAKVSDIDKNVFTTSDYGRFTNDIVDAKLKEKKQLDESNTSGFINNSNLDKNIDTLATKIKLQAEQNKIAKL